MIGESGKLPTLTERTASFDDDDAAPPRPGVVLVFAGGRPRFIPQTLDEDTELGRNDFAGAVESDSRMSRRHARVRLTGTGFEVEDLGSRNGTSVDGVRIKGTATCADGSVLRLGSSLVLLVADVRPFAQPRTVAGDGKVVGPILDRAWGSIRDAAAAGGSLLILGESGSGKELAASVFHSATGRAGPLIAVNCASVPVNVAERLFFGTKRGAYSGADRDAPGYFQAADGGTLFLDEIAELERDVQAKLLRAIESGQVVPLGASRPMPVDVRFCSATHTDLRTAVGQDRFREDLYFRIGRPEVRLPPLRERKEEIPWLIAGELGDATAHAALVETCLLRPWPGNVRELRAEIRRALAAARSRGSTEVTVKDLGDVAGTPILRTGAAISPPNADLVVRRRKAPPDDDAIRKALAEAAGNVTEAARNLGMHRTQLRRWIANETARNDRGT